MSHSRGSSSESERGGAARNGGEKKRKVYDGLRESGEEEEELTSVAQLISEIFQDDRSVGRWTRLLTRAWVTTGYCETGFVCSSTLSWSSAKCAKCTTEWSRGPRSWAASC